MSIRGIILAVKERIDPEGRILHHHRETHNRHDSYLSRLGRKLHGAMGDESHKKEENFDKEGFGEFENDILSEDFNNEKDITGMTPEDIDHPFREWICVVSRTGFQIWKSNRKEGRLHYCGWVRVFHGAEEAKQRLLISGMLEKALFNKDAKELPGSFL